MSRRMWVLAVTAWVGVVIAGSALTWLAINRAGDQVSSADAETTQPVVISTVNPAPKPKPSRPRSTGPSPSPALPTGRTAPTPAPTPARTARPTPSSPRTSAPAAATARTETRTWTGTAGFVTVSCAGSLARLQAASPNTGWSVERGDEAGDHVEVKFERNGVEVQVQATCVGGVPQFRAETGGDRSGE